MVGVEVRREAGRRADHHDPVHPVGAGAELAAQARRTELQGAGEPVGDGGRCGLVAVCGGLDLGLEGRAGGGVEVLGGPRAGRLQQRVGIGHGGTVARCGTLGG